MNVAVEQVVAYFMCIGVLSAHRERMFACQITYFKGKICSFDKAEHTNL
jgi:hypothetical protein